MEKIDDKKSLIILEPGLETAWPGPEMIFGRRGACVRLGLIGNTVVRLGLW